MAQNDTYQTKTYHERPGDAFVFGSGGMAKVESGGAIRGPVVVINPSTTAETFSLSMLPFSYGTVIYSAGAAAAWSASCRLGSCSVGGDVMIMLRGDPTGTFTNETAELDFSISGTPCILLLSEGKAGAGWFMYTSAASDPWVHIKCFTDGVWSIVGTGGKVLEA